MGTKTPSKKVLAIIAAAGLGFLTACSINSGKNLPHLGIAKPATLEEIAEAKPEKTQLYMYDNDTLVINFGHNYAQQNATFGRIGTLCEGYGVERNVLPKEASAIGARAVGHDYTSTELALFYNLARGQSLNRSERQLRELVIENGLIADVNGTYEPVQTESCIISFIHNSQWRDILAHELSHAEYFTNDTYREYCNNFWNEVMTPDDRKGFTNFLRWDYYDITNTDLTINETQAYLANTCDMYSSSLFNMPEGRADELRAQFIKDSPVPSFCETLDSKINGEQ